MNSRRLTSSMGTLARAQSSSASACRRGAGSEELQGRHIYYQPLDPKSGKSARCRAQSQGQDKRRAERCSCERWASYLTSIYQTTHRANANTITPAQYQPRSAPSLIRAADGGSGQWKAHAALMKTRTHFAHRIEALNAARETNSPTAALVDEFGFTSGFACLFAGGRLAVGHATRNYGWARVGNNDFPVPVAITAWHNPELDVLGHGAPGEFALPVVSGCYLLHRIRSTEKQPNRARIQTAGSPPLSLFHVRTAYTVLDSSNSLSRPLN